MSWECRYKAGDHCNKLNTICDPGRKGCVLHGRFYFPFAPEKNSRAITEALEADANDDEPASKPMTATPSEFATPRNSGARVCDEVGPHRMKSGPTCGSVIDRRSSPAAISTRTCS